MAQTGYTPISLYYSSTASAAPTAGNLVAGELAINTADGKLFYKDSAGVVQTLATKDTTAGTFTSITDSGNLTFTGTGNRIRGDFSNATLANRVQFQSSTVNGSTVIGAVPNGTSVVSSFQAYNNSDPTNSSGIGFVATSTDMRLSSTLFGTGSYLPMTFLTGGSERLRIDTSGNVGIGTSSPSAQLTVANDASISGLTVGKGGGAVATNTAVGAFALNATNTGGLSVGVGYNAGNANTSGRITAVGYGTLSVNTTGINTAVGYASLSSNTTGTENNAFGDQALAANTTGGYNVAVGDLALRSNTTASNNTAVGYQAGYSNTTGGNGTFIGGYAGRNFNNASSNLSDVYVGYNAGSNTSTGRDNTVVGGNALTTNSSGSFNIAVGGGALLSNTTASNNTAVGYQAGYSNTTGIVNTLIGSEAGYSSAGGSSNVVVGRQAMYYNTSGNNNTVVGTNALQNNTTASNNTAVGYQAGYTQSTGASNTFLGTQSGYAVTTGNNNTILGYRAGYSLTTGQGNTFIGGGATDTYTSGYFVTTGSKNSILGNYSGNQGGLDIRTASNYIVLSDGDGNPRIWHRGSDNAFNVQGVYDNTSGSGANVVISGTGFLIRSTSALKYKQDIRNLESIDINKFRPVRYKSKCSNDDPNKDFFGVIADEVAEAGITELVTYGTDGEVEGFQYERLTVVLLKTIQDLQKRIEILENK